MIRPTAAQIEQLAQDIGDLVQMFRDRGTLLSLAERAMTNASVEMFIALKFLAEELRSSERRQV